MVLAFLAALMSIVRQKMEAKGNHWQSLPADISADCAGCRCAATCAKGRAADAEEKVNRRNMTDAEIIIDRNRFSAL